MIGGAKIAMGVAFVAAAIWLFIAIRDQGADSARTYIERQNNAAGSTADDARGSYGRCPDGL